jgi:hypothetical protein
MSRGLTRAALAAALLCCAPEMPAQPVTAARDTTFAGLVATLSEAGGYFDSDNLISNETSYLHVLTRLDSLGVRGGAYIGVGPDQNYSYVAAMRPSVAYMLDVRRDNALQHLLFKALFARSAHRLEFLCRWLGRRVPPDAARWSDRPILDLLAWIDSTPLTPDAARQERRETMRVIETFGVPLTAEDRSTLDRFHATFMRDGLNLRFSSFGRGNAADYPTLRRLIVERDLDGTMRSYLADERSWRVVRDLHAANRIIPVVGNLAGPHALAAIGRDVTRRNTFVSALYTSNAELYIWRDGGFGAFASTVGQLPVRPASVIIRSYFDRSQQGHPFRVPGHVSVQLLQRVSDFNRRVAAGAFRSYYDVVTLDAR